jgi:tripartite-type tricarboxylate transporter receptor subunit TctC
MLSAGSCIAALTLALSVAGMTAAQAQDYPTRPIRIVTGSGSSDVVSRLIAQNLSTNLGEPVIVDNRPGILGIEIAAKADPDGYTLLLYGSGLWLLPYLQNNVAWDPLRDFAPVSSVVSAPVLLLTNPSLNVSSVKDLIALARAKPGAINWASPAAGSGAHLAGELFKSMAGINVVRVPYKSGNAALTALISGEVQFTFASAGTVTPLLKTGKLRALAVSSAQPSALAPDLPTIASAGLPGYEATVTLAMFAPAKTPPVIVQRLNQDIVRFLHANETRERILATGSEATGGAPGELATAIKSEMTRMGKVITEAGIRAD